MPTSTRIAVVAIILVTVVVGSYLPQNRVAAQLGPTNLLINGDFEAWDPNASWPFQDGIPEVQVCPGWHAFYVDVAPEGVTAPTYWKRPEFRDVKSAEYAYRVHDGFLAQKYFTFGGQHIAGLYQQVTGIVSGTALRFSIYMQTWSCMAGDEWNVCPTGAMSNSPSPMHTRVGIDPYGGTNPWSPNIVWSAEIDAYDQWTLFSVDAIAQAGTVTVFTHSYADWFDSVFRMANDVYIDSGSLIALDELAAPLATALPSPTPTATLDPSLPTATPVATSTLPPTSTPRPDGAIVYVVREGDSLGAIAVEHGLTVDQILALNDLVDPNVVDVGQEIVISIPAVTETPAPLAATPLPTGTPMPTPTATEALPTPTLTASAVPAATELPLTGAETAAEAAALTRPEGPSALWLIAVLIGGVGLGFIFGRRVPR
ncbi:MAG: LysM peptidoglycan-binding domain-containing protein [Anaerolineae bacterium]|nr:LysM peptidoglycan-binding domain-containing protein [Anaerolineae bacterium]